jgi:hypothetical protein
MSEVGNALCAKPDCAFSLVWNYNHRDRCNYVSLRAATEAVDVSAIATMYGGGKEQRGEERREREEYWREVREQRQIERQGERDADGEREQRERHKEKHI